MGDWSDLMLDGVVCQGCGVYLGDPVGHPQFCAGCEGATDVASDDWRSEVPGSVQYDDLEDEDDLPF